MKRLTMLAAMLFLSALLVLPALAAKQEKPAPGKQLPEQAQAIEQAQDPHQSAVFKRQQAYQEKRKAMKAMRDRALEVRERNVKSNSPGNTGL